MAAIPDDLFPDLDPMIFDLNIMREVYAHALEQGRNGYVWAKSPPGLDPDEVLLPTGGASR